MRDGIGKFIGDRRGATAIGYGLIVALIVIVTLAGIRQVGGGNGGLWGNFTSKVAAVEA
jgi:pilus assembly protein Flp/PilA